MDFFFFFTQEKHCHPDTSMREREPPNQGTFVIPIRRGGEETAKSKNLCHPDPPRRRGICQIKEQKMRMNFNRSTASFCKFIFFDTSIKRVLLRRGGSGRQRYLSFVLLSCFLLKVQCCPPEVLSSRCKRELPNQGTLVIPMQEGSAKSRNKR